MGFFRTLFFILLVYWIFKAFQRIIAPFFAGYYGKGEAQAPKEGKVVIRTDKADKQFNKKPNINRIEAEDVDFEEIKD